MKKKILLTLGSVAAVVTPIATVVACGVNTQTTEPNIEAPTVGGDAEQSKATVGKKYNLITITDKAEHNELLRLLHSHILKQNTSGWIPTSNIDNKFKDNIIYAGGVDYRLSKIGNKDTNDSVYISKDESFVMIVLTSVADDKIEKLFVSAAPAPVETKESDKTPKVEAKLLDYDWNNPKEFVPHGADSKFYIMDMLSDEKDERGVNIQGYNVHNEYVSSFGMQDELLSNTSSEFEGEFQDVKHEAQFLSTWNIISESQFAGSPNVTSLAFHEIDAIKASAFKDSKITSLYMKKVTEIGDNAFMSIVNDSSTTVRIPSLYNSDEEKDRIFGKDNWNNIDFDFHDTE